MLPSSRGGRPAGRAPRSSATRSTSSGWGWVWRSSASACSSRSAASCRCSSATCSRSSTTCRASVFPVVWAVMQLGNVVAVPILAAAAALARRFRMARDLLVSGLLAYLAADLIKSLVRRERPGGFAVGPVLPRGTDRRPRLHLRARRGGRRAGHRRRPVPHPAHPPRRVGAGRGGRRSPDLRRRPPAAGHHGRRRRRVGDRLARALGSSACPAGNRRSGGWARSWRGTASPCGTSTPRMSPRAARTRSTPWTRAAAGST